MITSIKAEFRKVLTIRSTYMIMLFCLIMIGLFAFYGQGLKFEGQVVPPTYLQQQIGDAVNALALFIALVGVLLMTHEYRYNTIMYTLTASNSRNKTLLAKIITTSIVSLVMVSIFAVLSPLAAALGLTIKGLDIPAQTFYFKDLIWHVLLYGWGFAMAGLLIAILVRNQIGVIVTLLLFPTSIEPLLGLVLKGNDHYLPFLALGAVINHNDQMSAERGAIVFLTYLVVGWIIGWILFLRRDAN
jgi:ABC-type transport system involved in multi-copper enzyme maturation permease subunit